MPVPARRPRRTPSGSTPTDTTSLSRAETDQNPRVHQQTGPRDRERHCPRSVLTVSEDSTGRWNVAFQTLVHRTSPRPATSGPVSRWSVSTSVSGRRPRGRRGTGRTRTRPGSAAPKSLTAAQERLRALQRRAARQHGPYDPSTRTKRQPSTRWGGSAGSVALASTLRRCAAMCCTSTPPSSRSAIR